MKKIVLMPVIALSSILLGFLILEFLLRVFWGLPTLEEKYKRNDFQWLQGNVVLNSDNWRDKDYKKDKPDDRYRILVLGDSYSFGWYIDNPEDVYSERVEKDLGIDVINAARHGFSLEEELNRLKEEGITYHPDLVLVGLNIGEFVDLATPKPQPIFEFLRDSYLYKATIQRFLEQRQNNDAYERYKKYFQGDDTKFQERSKLLLALKETSEIVGAKFGIVIFPELNPQNPNSNYLFEDYHKKLTEFANKNDIFVFDPLDKYLAVEDKTQLVLNPFDSHPSVLANQLVAEEIEEKIDLSAASQFAPKVNKVDINSIGQKLENVHFIRSISNYGNLPVVTFNREYDLAVEEKPVSGEEKELPFLEDKLKTVKSFTHDGWPGALIEFNINPASEFHIPANLYGYDVIGIREIKAFYKTGEVEKSKLLLPDKVKVNNGLDIDINLSDNIFLLRIGVLVKTAQLDIDREGTIADATHTVELNGGLTDESNRIEFETDGNIGSTIKYYYEDGSFDYAYVNGVMKRLSNVNLENNKVTLTFKDNLSKDDNVTFFVNKEARLDQKNKITIEYE